MDDALKPNRWPGYEALLRKPRPLSPEHRRKISETKQARKQQPLPTVKLRSE